ncbi:MAG TPA: AAA family ATPase, partial [Pyrinomonadaceae bacterium]|nr:AAA family ATPase [Pyrinomonadaceae bacterium]
SSAKRPVGSFLFLGATGVGKTEVARSLAEFLFGSEKALIRLDMSEYMEKHTVAKLIGSPPGYVGHEEGGQLTEKLRRQPYSVVLFDEVEKAHPDLFNILLQVFEDGTLTDSHGNSADCRHAIFIMTSNIGARFIQKRSALGFQANAETNREKVEENVLSAVKQTFSPEFLNRLDEIIVFDELSDEDLLEIIDLQVNQLNKTLETRGWTVSLTEEARGWLMEKTCKDRTYGARPLRRALQRYVEDLLADAAISGKIEGAETIEIFRENDLLDFRVLKRESKKTKNDEIKEVLNFEL